MNKLVIIVGSSIIGGAEKQSLLLAKMLENHFQVTLIFLGKPGPIIEKAQEMNLKSVSSKGSFFSDSMIIFRTLVAVRPLAIINILYRADILGGIIGRLCKTPRILNSARNTLWPNSTFMKRTLLVVVSKCIPNVIVANSNHSKAWHEEIGYPSRKLVVIENFLSIDDFISSKLETAERNYPVRLGIASRPVIGKGHKTLILAANNLLKNGVDCEVWFKGYGIPDWFYQSDLYSFCKVPINLQGGGTDMIDWYSQIDIYCGISEQWESDSNSINEAILANKSVIMTNLISSDSYFPPVEVIKPGSISEVESAVTKILQLSSFQLKSNAIERRFNLINKRSPQEIIKKWTSIINF
jgi:glycosyltransferase involved in cell wall biosynthesis